MDFQQAIVNLQLLDAIAQKDLSRIAELLDQGADVNHKNLHDKNNTPLHYAADCPEITKLLLARGANSTAANDAGITPLELAQNSPKRDVEGECSASSRRSPVLTYFKRPGTASILGQWYESKLLALVLFRSLHWDRIAEFYLATNVDDAGAFDDLVIRYRTAGGIDRLVCLQAKHKPGKALNLKDVLENVGEKGDFSLGKYFKSFLDIKLRCYEGNQSAIFGDIESEKFKPFKMSDEDCINLPQEFFNKLQFHTEQSTEAEVEQLVKNEIPDHCPTTGDLNLIFQMYHLGVQQWWLQTGAVPFQTKSSALFRVISMGKLQVYKQELCPEKLGEALTKEVQRFVNDRDSHTMPIVGGLIESSVARLVEYLRSKDEDQVNFKFVNTDVANFKDKDKLSKK
ncbi:hypothetical protein quinque_006395 [Culex quinquefasciatus]